MMGVWEVPLHFKRVPTKIIKMEMTNDENEMCMVNIDVSIDDLKYYVETSNILES